jgi:hypothetical protein
VLGITVIIILREVCPAEHIVLLFLSQERLCSVELVYLERCVSETE